MRGLHDAQPLYAVGLLASAELDCEVQERANAHEQADKAEGSPQALLRVAGAVAQAVGNLAGRENDSADCAEHRVGQTADEEEEKELGVGFQRILVRALRIAVAWARQELLRSGKGASMALRLRVCRSAPGSS